MIRGIKEWNTKQWKNSFAMYLELYGANHQCWNCIKLQRFGFEDNIIYRTDLIHLAVYSNMLPLVHILVKNGAIVKRPTDIINSSYGICYTSDINLFSSVVDDKNLPLNVDNHEIYPKLEMLLRHGHNPNEIYYAQNSGSKTQSLCEYFIFTMLLQPDILQLLLNYRAHLVDDNASLLHFFKTVMSSAETNAVKSLDAFLKTGMDPNVEPIPGQTALVMAILNGETEGTIQARKITFSQNGKISNPYRLDQGGLRVTIMKVLLMHGASQPREEIERAFDMFLGSFNKFLLDKGYHNANSREDIDQFAAESIDKANVLLAVGLISRSFHLKVVLFNLCKHPKVQ